MVRAIAHSVPLSVATGTLPESVRVPKALQKWMGKDVLTPVSGG